MLTCLPKFLCSWDFRVTGLASGPADLSFNFFTEQGSISFDGVQMKIRKHGPLSGRWTLEDNGETLAEGHKPSAMFRAFKIRSANAEIELKAASAFARGFQLSKGGSIVGTIRPAHAFTRRAFIDCSLEVPELIQLFSFWLVVVTWRRAANNSNSGAANL